MIGVIGLGVIGRHFTEKLRDGNYDVLVNDLQDELVQRALATGAKYEKSLTSLVSKCDIIIMPLPGDKALKTVMEGEGGILSGNIEGKIIIDAGTCSPDIDVHYHKICKGLGAEYMEAPVTWRAGGLILMCAGEEETYAKCEKVIDCISYKHKYLGKTGRGQQLKAVNQVYLSLMHASQAEVVEYARSIDIGKDLINDFLEFNINPAFYKDEFPKDRGATYMYYKDLLYAMNVAHESGASIPLTHVAYEAYKFAMQNGDSITDPRSIVRYWRTLNNVKDV